MKKLFSVLALCASVPFASAAQDIDDVVQGRLLPGWRMEDGRHMAAIQLTLAPGWKTYWRAPGDAGIPPRFDWRGSENLAAVAPHWPVPEVFRQNGMRSVGYGSEVTIPLELSPQDADQPIAISGQVEIGVCEDICIPVTLRLEAALPDEAGAFGTDAIRAALAKRPLTRREARVENVVCRVEPIEDGLRLTVTVDMPRLSSEEEAVVEFSDPTVWISEATTQREGRRLIAVTEMVPPDARPFAMSREGVRITVLGDGRAVDIRGCAAS